MHVVCEDTATFGGRVSCLSAFGLPSALASFERPKVWHARVALLLSHPFHSRPHSVRQVHLTTATPSTPPLPPRWTTIHFGLGLEPQKCSGTGVYFTAEAGLLWSSAPPLPHLPISALLRRHSDSALTMAIDRQSQKPTDDLYKNFKANFTSFHHGSVVASAPGQVATSLADVADMRLHRYAHNNKRSAGGYA